MPRSQLPRLFARRRCIVEKNHQLSPTHGNGSCSSTQSAMLRNGATDNFRQPLCVGNLVTAPRGHTGCGPSKRRFVRSVRTVKRSPSSPSGAAYRETPPPFSGWGYKAYSAARRKGLHDIGTFQGIKRVQIEPQCCVQLPVSCGLDAEIRRSVLVGAIAKRRETGASASGSKISAGNHRPGNHARPGAGAVEVEPQFGIHRLVKHLKGISWHLVAARVLAG